MTTSAAERTIAGKYRTAALCGALVVSLILPGCPTRQVRRALDLRIDQAFTEVTPPLETGRYQVGVAMTVPAVEALVRAQLEAFGRVALDTTSPIPGLESVELALDWDRLVVELRPAPALGPSALFVLMAVPGDISTRIGGLTVQERLRVSARLPLALEGRVLGGGAVELGIQVADVEQLLVAVALEGSPPGADSFISAAVQAHARQWAADKPLEPLALGQLDSMLDFGGPLPLAEVDVLAFPGGKPTVFVGALTSLPVDGEPGVDPRALLPGESDWAVQADDDVLAAFLARAGLSGKLGAGIVSAPDRLDLSELRLDEGGFWARLHIWRIKPPSQIVDIEATGQLGWKDDCLVLRLQSLERPDKGEIAARRMPLNLELGPVDLPWPIDALETLGGGVIVRGRLPEPDPS